MERLCDEIIQIILNEIDDPTNFSLISKRFYTFTQDPYIRASYFLWRYGKIQALYWAMGRGRLMNERVIDILLSSGAHISRYFVQCAMHHYYRTAQVPFVKTPWVRSMHLGVFTYFQGVAVKMYGNIPLGKGDDDGSIMEAVIKENRLPAETRIVKWETLREILEKYKFIPFCHKDAMMANFPLVLAIEPGLLPYAAANGFLMDHRYRNFVFRKMFEKPAMAFDSRTDEIVRNVRELSRLDAQMYLTRTVAAEICMEAKLNDHAYNALKRLDKEGLLKFNLSTVVEDLIKTFSRTRSITYPQTGIILRQLYTDFPSNDPTVRLVLLLQIFQSECASPGIVTINTDIPHKDYVENCRQKIDSTGLGPVKRSELVEILCSRFAPEKFRGIIEYGRVVLNLLRPEVEALVQEVAFKCLEIGCKGKMVARLVELYDFLHDAIRIRVLKHYRLSVDDLPPSDQLGACAVYEAPLCQDFVMPRTLLAERLAELRNRQEGVGSLQFAATASAAINTGRGEEEEADESAPRVPVNNDDLGPIGQESLTTMIRKDELGPARNRRRFYDAFTTYHETSGQLPYPPDNISVGKWVREHYGPRAAVTAVFMINAVINMNPTILQPFAFAEHLNLDLRVPLTLKHFKLLARLGRAPPMSLIDEIEIGTEFYFSEEDYLDPDDLSGAPSKKPRRRKSVRRGPIPIKMVSAYTVKTEPSPTPEAASPTRASISAPPTPKRGRPRRSAASTINYVVPDSDDEMIMEEGTEVFHTELRKVVKTRKVESNLQKWIRHLTPLLHEEQKKLREKKKILRASAPPGEKIRTPKNDFVKSLSAGLLRLRKADREKRRLLYGDDVPDDDYSSGEEDEYHERRPAKRRKVEDA